jgi:hypothetical protein
MKVNLIEVPTPMFTEFRMMGEVNKELLKETKTVRVSPHHHTKTRIGTSMQIGDSRNGINFEVEGFKTFESREHSYFTGEVNIKHYFVKSKKQNIEAYKEYVKKVVAIALTEYLGVELDEITIELEVNKF